MAKILVIDDDRDFIRLPESSFSPKDMTSSQRLTGRKVSK